jgi:hypothetical protein
MQILLVEAGIIMLYKVAHFHVNIKIIFSVMHISPFTNDSIIYITFVYCVLLEDGYIH